MWGKPACLLGWRPVPKKDADRFGRCGKGRALQAACRRPYNHALCLPPAHAMNIIVNEDLKAYIDPLTADEHAALERSLLAEGCRDALGVRDDAGLLVLGDVEVDTDEDALAFDGAEFAEGRSRHGGKVSRERRKA